MSYLLSWHNLIFLIPLGLCVGIVIGIALVARGFPKTESYPVSQADLLGRLGTLVLPASEGTGLVQVNDHEGNLHQMLCRSRSGPLPKGSEVLVVDRLEDEDVYVVEPSPFGSADVAAFRLLEPTIDE